MCKGDAGLEQLPPFKRFIVLTVLQYIPRGLGKSGGWEGEVKWRRKYHRKLVDEKKRTESIILNELIL